MLAYEIPRDSSQESKKQERQKGDIGAPYFKVMGTLYLTKKYDIFFPGNLGVLPWED